MSGAWDYLMVFLIAVNFLTAMCQAAFWAIGLTSGRWFALWLAVSTGGIVCAAYSITHN